MARRKNLNASQLFELEKGLEKLGAPTDKESDTSSEGLLWLIVKKSHPLRLYKIDATYWSPSCKCDSQKKDLCYHCFMSYFIPTKDIIYLK